jgi:hypothetical protein
MTVENQIQSIQGLGYSKLKRTFSVSLRFTVDILYGVSSHAQSIAEGASAPRISSRNSSLAGTPVAKSSAKTGICFGYSRKLSTKLWAMRITAIAGSISHRPCGSG